MHGDRDYRTLNNERQAMMDYDDIQVSKVTGHYPLGGRYCIHQWSEPVRVGRFDVTWECLRCGEVRALSGDKPIPGTFVAASENFSNALRNLGLEIRDTLPGPLRQLFTPEREKPPPAR